MVMASLNQFLCDEYKLHRFGYVLEVPLDNTVTKKLRAVGKGEKSCAPRAVLDIQY